MDLDAYAGLQQMVRDAITAWPLDLASPFARRFLADVSEEDPIAPR